jgi:hypothetical protein
MTEETISIPHFTRLRGNAKGVFDEAIGQRTLYVGRNQSGKSGRLISVRYALGGVAGWTLGVHGSDIATLAPEGSEVFLAELSSEVALARFEAKSEGGKWREPEKKPLFEGLLKQLTPEQREKVLPLVAMSDLLTLGPDLGRRALMERFGNARTVPEPAKLLPDQKKLWDSTLAKTVEAMTKKADPLSGTAAVLPDPSDVLVALNKAFNKLKLDAGKKIKGLDASVEERRDRLAKEAAGAEQLPALRDQLKVASAWESVAHFREKIQQLEADKARYREAAAPIQASDAARPQREADQAARRQELEAAIATAEQQVAAIGEDIAAQLGKLSWGTNLKAAIERSSTSCPLCKTTKIHLENGTIMPYNRDSILAVVGPGVAVRELSVKTAQDRLHEAQAGLQNAHAAKQAFENQIMSAKQADGQVRQRLTQEHARILSAEGVVKEALTRSNAPASYSGPGSAVLKAQIEALEAAEVARKKLDDDTSMLRVLKAEQKLAKDLEEESKKELDRFIARVQETAEAAVNRYMPDGLRAALDLDGNTWNVIDTKGHPRSKHTMCGFESGSLVVALASAYTEGSPLRVLTLDDPDIAGVGLENVPRFFGALSRAVAQGWLTQLFVAGNRLEPVTDYLRSEGWTVIRTDDDVGQPQLHVVPQPPSIAPVIPIAPGNGPSFSDLFHDNGVPRL